MQDKSLLAEGTCAIGGQRLDEALAAFLPGMGLRGRRRLIRSGHVLVNGSPGSCARKLRVNDQIKICFPRMEACPDLKVVAQNSDYTLLYKPAGIHSAELAGGDKPSLEGFCKAIFPGIRLLQRLDYGTSGLLCGALNEAAARNFRIWEKAGACEKYYLALLSGELKSPELVDKALDTANRKKSVALTVPATPLYWTEFTPIRYFQAGAKGLGESAKPRTLALCVIKCGQRHQIRAHAASIGHPLINDALYGESLHEEGENNFLLEHFAIKFPGLSHIYNDSNSLLARLDAIDKEKVLAQLEGRAFAQEFGKQDASF